MDDPSDKNKKIKNTSDFDCCYWLFLQAYVIVKSLYCYLQQHIYMNNILV